jgi:hypothetical protein
MVCLLKFDKVNVKHVNDTPAYKNAETELLNVQKPRRQAEAEVNFYTEKLENIKKEEVPADKKKAKEHLEDIEKTENTLAGKVEDLEKVDASIAEQNIFFEAIKAPYDDLTNQVGSAKKIFKITLWITIILFIAKIKFFATWNFKMLHNLRITSPWMKKSTAPYWAFLGWIVPGYNFIKPYMVFSEVYSETKYILLDKNIIEKDPDEGSDFSVGLWWGLFLITTVLISLLLDATFFGQGPAYFKLSHSIMAITAIVFYALYLLQESVLIRKGIKMDQILFENRPKFDLQ